MNIPILSSSTSNEKFKEMKIDISDLIEGYNMLFHSKYSDALSFFQSKKD